MNAPDAEDVGATLFLLLALLGAAAGISLVLQHAVEITLLVVAVGLLGVLVNYPAFRRVYVWVTAVVVHVCIVLAVLYLPLISTASVGSFGVLVVVSIAVLSLSWFGFQSVFTGEGK
jgi:hypothetical protein